MINDFGDEFDLEIKGLQGTLDETNIKLIEASVPIGARDAMRFLDGVFSEEVKGVLASVGKQLNESYELFISYMETSLPEQYNFIKKCKRINWVPSMQSEFSINFIQWANDLTDDELNKYYLRLYTRNDNAYLVEELKLLENKIPINYKPVVKLMIDSIVIDSNYFRLHIATLYTLMDHLFVRLLNNENDRDKRFMRIAWTSKIVEKYEDEKHSEIINAVFYEMLEIIGNHLEFQSFDEENLLFTRHSVSHGKYEPANYKYSEYIRLVVLITTMACFAY